MLEQIKASIGNIELFCKGISTAFANPGAELTSFLTKFFTECLETFALASFDILVVVGFFSLVLYVFGWKKGKDIGLMCPAIYIIVQILSKCLVG